MEIITLAISVSALVGSFMAIQQARKESRADDAQVLTAVQEQFEAEDVEEKELNAKIVAYIDKKFEDLKKDIQASIEKIDI